MQKVTFYALKGNLLECERLPFATGMVANEQAIRCKDVYGTPTARGADAPWYKTKIRIAPS